MAKIQATTDQKMVAGNGGGLHVGAIPQGTYTTIVEKIGVQYTVGKSSTFMKLIPVFHLYVGDVEEPNHKIDLHSLTVGTVDENGVLYAVNPEYSVVWGGTGGAAYFLKELGLYDTTEGGSELDFDTDDINNRVLRITFRLEAYVKGQSARNLNNKALVIMLEGEGLSIESPLDVIREALGKEFKLKSVPYGYYSLSAAQVEEGGFHKVVGQVFTTEEAYTEYMQSTQPTELAF